MANSTRLAQRHAAYFLTLFDSFPDADTEFATASSVLALEIDNLRAALEWAFAPRGDLAVGVGLAAASVPLWVSRSMLGEWHVLAERAIQSLDKAGLGNTRQEMVLRATLGMSFQLVRNRASEAFAALTRALEIAEEPCRSRLSVAHPPYAVDLSHADGRGAIRDGDLPVAPTRLPTHWETPSRR